MRKKKPTNLGRPRIGLPLSVTFTDEQRAWLEAQGGTITETVRAVVQQAMEGWQTGEEIAALERLKEAAITYRDARGNRKRGD